MSTTRTPPADETRCPCGRGDTFGACCGPVLRQERRAATAEALMRSRYTAFAVGDVEHLLRSWHPRERPDRDELADSLEDGTRWVHLSILTTSAGGPFDDAGTVEFTAVARTPQGGQEQHEISRFVREDGTWLFVDGEL
ncbi:YchJ family protein [Brachybacterium tyrofermentans]|uniref:YchJ family protein n=1 Tax=Brachybacterium tyrofermentans TaxID=47848 RepID=UPI0018694615|nr:YchJ family metal-binding protein [Brachybacterium tyrofermentans]